MAHALFSDLEQSAFMPGKIGGPTQCVKVFKTEVAAIDFAADLIRKHVKYDDGPSEAVTDDEVLEEFQSCLGGMEYFHIYPVVD
jgi:hypothetical protein